MNLHRIYYPTLALGPGKRIGIWTRGCSLNCKNCMSVELQTTAAKFEIPLEHIIDSLEFIFSHNLVNGVTISGGEPFEQYEEIIKLLSYLNTKTQDILIYTGYTPEELKSKFDYNTIKNLSGALIAGKYIEEKNDGSALIGSSNQVLIFNRESLKNKYKKILTDKRTIQLVNTSKSIFSIGILG